MQGDSAHTNLHDMLLPGHPSFRKNKRKACFHAMMVKNQQGKQKGLVYNFWGREYITLMQRFLHLRLWRPLDPASAVTGTATQIWLCVRVLKVNTAMFSRDCNSRNQSCIFHKRVILNPYCCIPLGPIRLLMSWSSQYCHVESVLRYSLP